MNAPYFIRRSLYAQTEYLNEDDAENKWEHVLCFFWWNKEIKTHLIF